MSRRTCHTLKTKSSHMRIHLLDLKESPKRLLKTMNRIAEMTVKAIKVGVVYGR